MPTHVIAVDGNTVNQATGDVVIPIYKREVTITDAQIKALPTTPIEIIAAPGENKIIFPISAIFLLNNWVANYTNIAADALLFLRTNNSSYRLLQNLAQATLTGVSDLLAGSGASLGFASVDSVPKLNNTFGLAGFDPTTMTNDSLVFEINNSGSGNLTGGDASTTLKVIVIYSIVDL